MVAPGVSYVPLQALACAPGQWAVGIHGKAGAYVDSLGLICATPPVPPRLVRPKGISSVGPALAKQSDSAVGKLVLADKAGSAYIAKLPDPAPAPTPTPTPRPAGADYAPPKGPHGLPLYACKSIGSDECGEPVALAFCQANGWTRLNGFDTDTRKTRAETLSGETCSKKKCKLFERIACLQ
jgi:hypothetical protein